MQRLEVSGAVRLIYRSLGVKGEWTKVRMEAAHPPESWYLPNNKASYSKTKQNLKR